MITQVPLIFSDAYIPASIRVFELWLSQSARTGREPLSVSPALALSFGNVQQLQFELSSLSAIACNALVWWSWLVLGVCSSRVDDIDTWAEAVYDIDTLRNKKTPVVAGAFIKIFTSMNYAATEND
jgi:hypothetical protein